MYYAHTRKNQHEIKHSRRLPQQNTSSLGEKLLHTIYIYTVLFIHSQTDLKDENAFVSRRCLNITVFFNSKSIPFKTVIKQSSLPRTYLLLINIHIGLIFPDTMQNMKSRRIFNTSQRKCKGTHSHRASCINLRPSTLPHWHPENTTMFFPLIKGAMMGWLWGNGVAMG